MADFFQDREKNLLEYHAVFASALASYFNLKKELEGTINDDRSVQIKRNELKSIIRSNLIYAIMLKRKDMENQEIPTDDESDFIKWINEKEKYYFSKMLSHNEVIEALFALMVRKQEVAGLTAYSEKTMVSRMNMLISKMDKEVK